jgi:hypothetical protein
LLSLATLANQNTSLNAHVKEEAAGNKLRSPVASATTNASVALRQFDNSSKLKSSPCCHTPEDVATAQPPGSSEEELFDLTATTYRPPPL